MASDGAVWLAALTGDQGAVLARIRFGGASGTRLWIDPAHDLVLVYLTGSWGGASEAIDDVQMAVYGAIG